MGKYYVANVSMKRSQNQNRRSKKRTFRIGKHPLQGSLGTGSIAGTAIMSSEISDDTLMALVKKHFNAVTFGNELKPDALFNYQIGQSVDSTTITFQREGTEGAGC